MLPQLVNLPRARALMERAGADALVAQLPINVYYLTGDSTSATGTVAADMLP
jgi:Xaa-Pro aminopeptidase